MSQHLALIWKNLDHLEEEKRSQPFTAVLLYMEKRGCLDSVRRWKEIRELRNAVNHEYEDDPQTLHDFFEAMLASTPELLRWLGQIPDFCMKNHPHQAVLIKPGAPPTS